MRKFIIVLGIFFLVISPVYANSKEKVEFSACVDGDTAKFIVDKEIVTVRFLAIDTPESVHPTKEEELFGKEASEYTCKKLTKAKEIILEYDDGSDKEDKYGRFLAWVYADGTMIQRELIKLGYAKVEYIYGDYKYTEELRIIESNAKSSRIGIWSNTKEVTTNPIYYVLGAIIIIFTLWKGTPKAKKRLKGKLTKVIEKELI